MFRPRLPRLARRSRLVVRRTVTAASFCSEPLEERRLLAVNILTPVQHAVDGGRVGFFADYTAGHTPDATRVWWGDGTLGTAGTSDPASPDALAWDYDASTGKGSVYGVHTYATPGVYSVTFQITGVSGSSDTEEFFTDDPGEATTSPEIPSAASDSTHPQSPAVVADPSTSADCGCGASMAAASTASAGSGTASADPMTASVEPAALATHVTKVFVNGPNLTNNPAWRNAAGADWVFGYPISDGANQLRPIPWTQGVNKVSIQFDQDVAATLDQADLIVRGSAGDLAVTGFTYDAPTKTGTWTLGSTVTLDELRLVLATAGVMGLDGEWTNPGAQCTGDTYPSGDGTPGGDFDFRINVLRDDATGDRAVNALDVADVKKRLTRRPGDGVTGSGAYSIFADVNADGVIDALDVAAVKGQLDQSLNDVPYPGGGLSLNFSGNEIIIVNNDDDNNNDLPDDEESGAISGENDLVPLNLQVNLPKTCPDVILTLTSGSARVWASAQRDAGGPVIGETTDPFKRWPIGTQPPTVYVEALAGSTAVGGLVFTLSGGDTQTSAKATGVEVAIRYNAAAAQNENATSKKYNVLVGQMVDVRADIVAPAEWKANPTYQWTVDGDILRDYKIAADGSTASTVALGDSHDGNGDIPANGLKQSRIMYFWKSITNLPPAPDHRTLKVTVGNINGMTFDRQTKFDVFSPTSAPTANMTGTVSFNQAKTLLGLFTNGAIPGITFTATVNVEGGSLPQGRWYFVQKWKRMRHRTLTTGVSQHWPHYGEWGLDNQTPYEGAGPWATGGANDTNDYPNAPLQADLNSTSFK